MPTIREAENILGEDFIGYEQLKPFFKALQLTIPIVDIPEIPFSVDKLESIKSEYILLLGIPSSDNGTKIDIRMLRSVFGLNPDEKSPCFYNQDWYLNEKFITITLELKWYLVKKNIISTSKSKNPDSFLDEYPDNKFPSAILCTFCFFAYYFSANGYVLWIHTFIWCNDKDHNGDRIYVGKYNDVEGVNKDGFSIHRHLSLRDYHGAIFFE